MQKANLNKKDRAGYKIDGHTATIKQITRASDSDATFSE